MTPPETDNLKKLAELIKGIRIAMLTTVDAGGILRSRPMATQQECFDGELWFFTSRTAHKVVEITTDHNVNLAYSDPADNRYVSISGVGRIIVDRKKAAALWTPMLKAWFPRGLEDPDLALLNVTPTQAEYWDAPSSKVVLAIDFAKSIFTGQPAGTGDHARLNLPV
jgi:general stress protein 26